MDLGMTTTKTQVPAKNLDTTQLKAARRKTTKDRTSVANNLHDVSYICNSRGLENAGSIQISLISIDNFDNIVLRTSYPITVNFRVTFGKSILGTSPPIEINNRFSHDIDFTCHHVLGEIDVKTLDAICREPYVISIISDKFSSGSPYLAEKGKSKQSLKDGTGSGQHRQTKSTSSHVIKSPVVSPHDFDLTSNVIYQQTFDPLPVLLGDDMNKETLLMKPLLGKSCLMVDTRYPVLCVAMKPYNLSSYPFFKNLMSISLESLINFDAVKLASYAKCTAKVHFIGKDSLDDSLKKIDFPTCVSFETSDVGKAGKNQPPAKRWFTLSNLPGDSGLSLYRNEEDLLDLRYPGMSDLRSLTFYEDLMKSSKLDLKWHQFRRMWLSPELQKNIQDNIMKHKNWLVELVFEKGPGNSLRRKSDDDQLRYVAYIDVSNLLHPGINSTRVLAHLWTYNPTHIEMMTGITTQSVKPQISTTNSISSKEDRRQTRSNVSQKSSEIIGVRPINQSLRWRPSTSTEIEGEPSLLIPPPPPVHPHAVEVFDEYEKPAFLILRVELFKSLLPRKALVDEKEILTEGAPDLKLQEYQKVTLQRRAWYYFRENVKEITEIIQQLFHHFRNLNPDCLEEDPESEESLMKAKSYLINDPASSMFVKSDCLKRDFFDWLLHAPEYEKVKEILKISIASYVKNFVVLPQIYTENEVLEFQSNLYTQLIGDVHHALCQIICFSDEEPKENICFTSSEVLLINAVEWSDKGNYDQAQSLLLKRIYYYGELDADLWIDLAIICLHHGKTAECKDALSHALSLHPRARDALVMYAVLMHADERYNVAEMFFNSLTEFYPRFYQGWIIFNLYYSAIENHQGRDVTLIMAGKCLADLQQSDSPTMVRKNSNCWSLKPRQDNCAYIETATYLLSLGLYEYVENCLFTRLIRTGDKSLEHYYYLAAAYHCGKKYHECEYLLDSAFRDFQDHGLYSMKGHNLYAMGKRDQARAMYKCAVQHPEARDDNFLCLLRYGEDLFENGDIAEGEVVFSKLAMNFPSAQSWNYLGRISFDAMDYEKSEKSFAVANHIDPTFSEPWAFLAMIAVIKKKFELAEKCLSEAKKYGNLGEDIIELIDCMCNANSAQIFKTQECPR